MNRFVLLTLALASVVFAQTANPEIDKAVLPAPAQLKAGAMVIKWKPDFTYETLRPGTNRLVCFDRSGLAGQQPFSVECTSVANLKRVAQNLKFEAIADAKERQAALDAAEKDGTREKPEFGSAWIRLQGRDQATARLHTTIAVPMATAQSLGLPDTGAQGGAWIMSAGTSTAHLMINDKAGINDQARKLGPLELQMITSIFPHISMGNAYDIHATTGIMSTACS